MGADARWRHVLLAATLAMVAFHRDANAGAEENQRQAEILIRRGVELRQAGNDDAAAREFRKAYDLARTPRAAAQMGLAEQALGRWEDAETHVSESLLAPRDPWIAKHQAVLRGALTNIKEHVGRVEVVGEPEGAEVLINGRVVGKTPLPDPVHVRAGAVDVELRAPGYTRASRPLSVAGGQYQSVVIRLEREGVAPAAGRNVAAAGSGPAGALGASTNETNTSPPPAAPPINVNVNVSGNPGGNGNGNGNGNDGSGEANAEGTGPPRIFTVAKWTAIGLTVGALAVGTTATLIRYDRTSTFDAQMPACSDVNGRAVLQSDRMTPVPYCQDLLNGYRSARTWQIVGFTAAGVFAAAALTLILTEPAATSTTRRIASAYDPAARVARDGKTGKFALFDWACAPMSTRPGLACQARF